MRTYKISRFVFRNLDLPPESESVREGLGDLRREIDNETRKAMMVRNADYVAKSLSSEHEGVLRGLSPSGTPQQTDMLSGIFRRKLATKDGKKVELFYGVVIDSNGHFNVTYQLVRNGINGKLIIFRPPSVPIYGFNQPGNGIFEASTRNVLAQVRAFESTFGLDDAGNQKGDQPDEESIRAEEEKLSTFVANEANGEYMELKEAPKGNLESRNGNESPSLPVPELDDSDPGNLENSLQKPFLEDMVSTLGIDREKVATYKSKNILSYNFIFRSVPIVIKIERQEGTSLQVQVFKEEKGKPVQILMKQMGFPTPRALANIFGKDAAPFQALVGDEALSRAIEREMIVE